MWVAGVAMCRRIWGRERERQSGGRVAVQLAPDLMGRSRFGHQYSTTVDSLGAHT